MTNKKHNNRIITEKTGFTLIELMYATVLSSIVMMAVGGLLAGYWKASMDFISDQQTMQEMSTLAKIFTREAKSLPALNMRSGDTAAKRGTKISDTGDGVIFYGTNTTSLAYKAGDKDDAGSVIYDTDCDDSVAGNSLLTKSIVNNVFTVFTEGKFIKMKVMIQEQDVNKLNQYLLYAAPRNYSHF